MRVEAARRLGDLHHEIADALDLVDHAQDRHEHAEVDRHRLLARQEVVGALLDRVHQVVDGHVGLDHALDRGEVGVEQGGRPGLDGLRRQRAEPDDVVVQLLQLLVERLPRLGHSPSSYA